MKDSSHSILSLAPEIQIQWLENKLIFNNTYIYRGRRIYQYSKDDFSVLGYIKHLYKKDAWTCKKDAVNEMGEYN